MKYDLNYSDISPEFKRAWNNDVDEARGLKAIRNSLVGIILTPKGSRPFYPEFGCDLKDLLFENMNAMTGQRIETAIVDAITAFEPRVIADRVQCIADYDSHSVNATVYYTVIDDYVGRRSPRQALNLNLNKELFQ